MRVLKVGECRPNILCVMISLGSVSKSIFGDNRQIVLGRVSSYFLEDDNSAISWQFVIADIGIRTGAGQGTRQFFGTFWRRTKDSIDDNPRPSGAIGGVGTESIDDKVWLRRWLSKGAHRR